MTKKEQSHRRKVGVWFVAILGVAIGILLKNIDIGLIIGLVIGLFAGVLAAGR